MFRAATAAIGRVSLAVAAMHTYVVHMGVTVICAPQSRLESCAPRDQACAGIQFMSQLGHDHPARTSYAYRASCRVSIDHAAAHAFTASDTPEQQEKDATIIEVYERAEEDGCQWWMDANFRVVWAAQRRALARAVIRMLDEPQCAHAAWHAHRQFARLQHTYRTDSDVMLAARLDMQAIGLIRKTKDD